MKKTCSITKFAKNSYLDSILKIWTYRQKQFNCHANVIMHNLAIKSKTIFRNIVFTVAERYSEAIFFTHNYANLASTSKIRRRVYRSLSNNQVCRKGKICFQQERKEAYFKRLYLHINLIFFNLLKTNNTSM